MYFSIRIGKCSPFLGESVSSAVHPPPHCIIPLICNWKLCSFVTAFWMCINGMMQCGGGWTALEQSCSCLAKHRKMSEESGKA